MKKESLILLLGIVFVFSIETTRAYATDTKDAPLINYLPPFNTSETHSRDISPFYRWTGVLARMDADTKSLQPWLVNKKMLEALPFESMVRKVNDIINKYDYIADIVMRGNSDYWETPAEFFTRGGDCEDFAIAKYAWLRSLGVSEERLRIAVVHDRIRNMPHAVLIIYISNKAMILDSQIRDIRDSSTTSRYRLLYSINRLGWWYPTASGNINLTMMGDTRRQTGAAGSGNAILFSKECLASYPLPGCINAIEPAAR